MRFLGCMLLGWLAGTGGVVWGGNCPGGICPTERFSMETATPHPAIVRIVVENRTTRNYGSGTWVHDTENHRFVLTCAHLFDQEPPQRVMVRFPNTFSLEVELLAIDRVWDLAVLYAFCFNLPDCTEKEVVVCRFLKPSEVLISSEDTEKLPKTIALGKTAPRQGEILLFAGYGPDGKYREGRGKLLGYCEVRGGKTSETLVVEGRARQGDSGGPILNSQGELVGVLWGTDGRTVCGTYNQRIQRFTQSAFPSSGLQELFPDNSLQNTQPPSTSPIVSGQSGSDELLLVKILQALQNFRDSKENPTVSPTPASRPYEDQNISWLGKLLINLFMAMGWSTPPALAIYYTGKTIVERLKAAK
ncbi:MAG: serine protease [Planctomycetia bacterium]|nr:serine protease [Planctomycetia bacterium]